MLSSHPQSHDHWIDHVTKSCSFDIYSLKRGDLEIMTDLYLDKKPGRELFKKTNDDINDCNDEIEPFDYSCENLSGEILFRDTSEILAQINASDIDITIKWLKGLKDQLLMSKAKLRRHLANL